MGASSAKQVVLDNGLSLPSVPHEAQTPLPAVVPGNRPKVALVLEGGGALGLAHVGVLKWFEDNRIPVDRIAGTSMGALIGSLYATGHTADDLQMIATTPALSRIFTLETAYTDVGYQRREDRRELPQAITMNLQGGIRLKNAVLDDAGLNTFLRRELSSYNSANVDFNRLPIPFRCVATDLNTLQPVVFDRGPIPEAIRASISIPGIFSPVQYRGHYLVDGATLDNLPTDVAKRDLDADIIIAVHLSDAPLLKSDVESLLGVFARAYSASTARSEAAGMELADVLLVADTKSFSTSDYARGKELIQVGYQAAEEHRAQLVRYQLTPEEWNAHLANRISRQRPAPGDLNQLLVQGGSQAAKDAVTRSLKQDQGKQISEAAIESGLRSVQGSGAFKASFETFSAASRTPDTSPAAIAPDTGVLVHLQESAGGRPLLLFGLDLTAETSNVTRTSFDFRLIDRELGGYGSELQTDVRVGFLTQIETQYRKSLTPTGVFVEPLGSILRKPVYIWKNQERTGERFEQIGSGGLAFGRTFNSNTQLAAAWKYQNVRWTLTSGSDELPDIIGTAQSGVVKFNYDRALAGAVSPRSLRVEVEAGTLFHAVSSAAAPLLNVRTSQTWPVGDKNIVGLGTELHTYFRQDVSQPFRFTSGGPLRLSASSVDEYRSTDTYLIRAGYLRKIVPLPSGIGQGLYFTGVYEAGEMWSPENPAYLRQDGLAAIVAATPLGVITLGGSIGDAGRRKFIFSLGRLF